MYPITRTETRQENLQIITIAEHDLVIEQHMKEAKERALVDEITRRENSKLAIFIKRLVSGLPLRRKTDSDCKKMLLESGTDEAKEALKALLKTTPQTLGAP